jgi:D-3-phosphoglycerate dehydrogenase
MNSQKLLSRFSVTVAWKSISSRKLGKDKEKLAEIIGNYDGLAIRSATKATEKLIAAATNLKVIGRAGIGVDNVDIPAASRRGIIVMNTPFGNSITTAEHAIALMFAVARQLPPPIPPPRPASGRSRSSWASRSPARRSASSVPAISAASSARRPSASKMHVLAYDPFLSAERAQEMGVIKVELDDLLAKADFITLHVPMTDKTRGILNAEALAKTKPGVRIINCARGGLVDERLLPRPSSPAMSPVPVSTCSKSSLPRKARCSACRTSSARRISVPRPRKRRKTSRCRWPSRCRITSIKGAVSNAINMPSITAEEAPRLKPFIKLADVLGAFVGQVTEHAIKEIEILYDGSTAAMNTKALTSALLAGLIRSQVADVNMVSAPVMIKEKGIILSEAKRDKSGVYDGYIKLTVTTEKQTRSVAGTVFSDGKPRFIQIKGINMDADVGANMIYISNTDVPGMIGFMGTTLGEGGVNIANFQLGRDKQGGDAIALLYVDEPVKAEVLDKLRPTRPSASQAAGLQRRLNRKASGSGRALRYKWIKRSLPSFRAMAARPSTWNRIWLARTGARMFYRCLQPGVGAHVPQQRCRPAQGPWRRYGMSAAPRRSGRSTAACRRSGWC